MATTQTQGPFLEVLADPSAQARLNEIGEKWATTAGKNDANARLRVNNAFTKALSSPLYHDMLGVDPQAAPAALITLAGQDLLNQANHQIRVLKKNMHEGVSTQAQIDAAAAERSAIPQLMADIGHTLTNGSPRAGALVDQSKLQLHPLAPYSEYQTGQNSPDATGAVYRAIDKVSNVTVSANSLPVLDHAPAMDKWKADYVAAGKAYGIDPNFLMAQAYQESGGNPYAYNPPSKDNAAASYGLAQFTVPTAGDYGLKAINDPAKLKPTDIKVDPATEIVTTTKLVYGPEASIQAQAKMMSGLMAEYHGDPMKALAAYNAGSSVVDAAVARSGTDWFKDGNITQGTRDYVRNIYQNGGFIMLHYQSGSEAASEHTIGSAVHAAPHHAPQHPQHHLAAAAKKPRAALKTVQSTTLHPTVPTPDQSPTNAATPPQSPATSASSPPADAASASPEHLQKWLDNWKFDPKHQQPAHADHQALKTPVHHTANSTISSSPHIVAVGDSLAYGTAAVNGYNKGVPGFVAQIGRQPQSILATTQQYGDLFKGKDVFLSSGATNNITENLESTVPHQIAALRQAGAKNIALIGVGKNKEMDSFNLNSRLQAIAKAEHVGFIPVDPHKLDPNSGGIHPTIEGYKDIAQKGTDYFKSQSYSVAAVSKSAPKLHAPV